MNTLRTLFRLWRKKRFNYESLIEVRIYQAGLHNNFKLFADRYSDVSVAPVLKSNAYGHGLVQVAKILEEETTPFFCVDSFFEALVLRNEGITKPILILGYTPIKNIIENTLKDISFSILSFDELQKINNSLHTSVSFHLKLDTGMHRHGVDFDHVGDALALIKGNKHIVVDGLYSHLADADTEESLHLENQIELWNTVAKDIVAELPNIKHVHCAATFGSAHTKKIFATTMRIGLGLYGFGPDKELPLEPVLELRARISSIRSIVAGESIGYNATFTARESMRLATIPVGYTEGLDRRLSNNGSVMIRGKLCPIVGRVSMNIASVDISALPEASLEDEAIVISRDRQSANSVESIARLCKTIPYEILVHIPAHLRRKVV